MLMNLSRDALKNNARNFFENYCTLNSSVHSRITRQMNMLHLPRIRTYLAKNCFYYNGSVIFNRLNFNVLNFIHVYCNCIWSIF